MNISLFQITKITYSQTELDTNRTFLKNHLASQTHQIVRQDPIILNANENPSQFEIIGHSIPKKSHFTNK